jgi:L-arabinose isomerase
MAAKRARVGVFGVGLAAYWPQFGGLEESIRGRLAEIERAIGAWAEVADGGLVDTATLGAEVGSRFAREDLDLVCCWPGTYATSTLALPVVQRSGAPVVILNLQSVPAIDYAGADTQEVIANVGVCGVPEMAGVLLRSGIPVSVVTGTLDPGDRAWGEIEAWCIAAKVARSIRGARFGLLGHTYPGMVDMGTDLGAIHGQLGAHVEVLEMNDLERRIEEGSEEAQRAVVDWAKETFTVTNDISREEWSMGARVALGIERLVEDFALDGLAYYYRGAPGSETERTAANMILGNTMITAKGIPAAGEGDLKTAVAMVIMQGLGCGGSFCEFLTMDLVDGFFIMGHDGPADITIAAGKPAIHELSVFHGKAGGGLAVQMGADPGPVTILGMTTGADGRLVLVAAEGENLPGDVPKIGNSLNRVRLGSDVPSFMSAWCAAAPTHHVAMGLGHQVNAIRKVATLLGLELRVVA